MMNQTMKMLAFDEILSRLSGHANSLRAKEMIGELTPYLDEKELERHRKETTQARLMLDRVGAPPLPVMEQVEVFLDRAVRGELLFPEEMEQIGMFLAAVDRMIRYLDKGKKYELWLAYSGENLKSMEELREEIERSIRGGRVEDYASGTLRGIRRELTELGEKIKGKAEAILKSQKKCMTENFVVNRNGRICLPVKKDFKAKVPGSVVDQSATGATVFIEPVSVAQLREKWDGLKIEEDCEERRILYCLMNQIGEQEEAMRGDLDTLTSLDFMFAKGKLSAEMDAVEPDMNLDGRIILKEARHPLLSKESCIPLDFSIGGEKRGMIITGPNTGGKTVAIKTVGLFTLMAGVGLHLPCRYADISMRNQVLCDIGDGQSIRDNLSTFSSHICSVLDILKRVTSESLVIIDELGSGTDPAEGMGIAIAVLERLRKEKCLYLVTTHDPEVKAYADKHVEIVNARMAFDRENLKPLYRLEMGKAGDSCALYIAARLGMPEDMLREAAKEAYGKTDFVPESAPQILERIPVPPIQKAEIKKALKRREDAFSKGDSVAVQPGDTIGIVAEPENLEGDVLVQIQKELYLVNRKRLKLKVAASELYPEDYDFSILFDTVENRKARHKMGKRYQKDLEIHSETGEVRRW